MTAMVKQNVRTSVSNPLEIAVVMPPGTAGEIGMTLCPGRKGSSLFGAAWDRDLALDLDAVRAWKPDLVLALLEEHEYPRLSLPNFRADVAAAGLPWAFAPIRDGGVPDEAFSVEWAVLGPNIRNILRRGGRVLIHCRAGLGRTGTIAASLLVDFGETPVDAMRAVRAVRTGAIEEGAQERYVLALRAPRARPLREAAISGCMFGAAAGDALGAAFEMVSAAKIEAFLGEPFVWDYCDAMRGSLLFPRGPGLPTDDTAMALSIADLVGGNTNLTAERFADAFLDDLDEGGRFATMFWTGGPGVATMHALARLKAGEPPATCGLPRDGGNGAAMRAHPIGILHDRTQVLHVAAVQARVTHGHPSAIAAAQAVAALVHDALHGFEPTLEPPYGIVDARFVDAWHTAHAGLGRGAARLPAHLTSVEMSAWGTVAAAAAIAYVFRDEPSRAIAAAAASGGDTDTVATIVGAIVGARNGVDALEPRWVAELDARALVERAVRLLVAS